MVSSARFRTPLSPPGEPFVSSPEDLVLAILSVDGGVSSSTRYGAGDWAILEVAKVGNWLARRKKSSPDLNAVFLPFPIGQWQFAVGRSFP